MDLQKILEDHAKWLQGCGGSKADLHGANLHGANLHGADLHGADLHGADLHGANLHGANLRWANLNGADLHGADLRGVNLRVAELRGADLRGANLYGADLHGVRGNREHIKTIDAADQYPIAYTATHLQIGCESHKIDDWWTFGDDRIIAMDGKKALRFWRKWKHLLRLIIETAPAEPTGQETDAQ